MAKYRVREFDEERGWNGQLVVHFHAGWYLNEKLEPWMEQVKSTVLVEGQEFDSDQLTAAGKKACEAGEWSEWVEPVETKTKAAASK